MLDPILSLRQCVAIEPGASISLAFTTALAESREQAVSLADYYHDFHSVHRAFELAWAHTQVELRQLHLTAAQALTFQRLTAHLTFAGGLLRPPREVVAANRLGQADLWRLGLSGDLPIVLFRLATADELPVARQMIAAHNFWRLKGLSVDLVILNEELGGYFEGLNEQLQTLVRASDDRNVMDKPGGVHLRKTTHLTTEDQLLLHAAARCVLVAGRGMLAAQLEGLARATATLPAMPPKRRVSDLPAIPAPPTDALLFDNGIGGFSRDGREYLMRIAAHHGTHHLPPRPWVNVIANPDFGFLISESGGGFTWAQNSQTHRLTPWRNDSVSDVPGEVLYLRDNATGEFWSATPLPCGANTDYLVRHGQGYTSIEHLHRDMKIDLTLFVPVAEPIKIYRLVVRNLGTRSRRLSACLFAEWVLGTDHDRSSAHVVTEIDAETGALFARNHWDRDFAERVAFADVNRRPCGMMGSRTEFLGRNGDVAAPAALLRKQTSGSVGACLDACAAVQTTVDVPAGEEVEILFLLGEGANLDDARRLTGAYRESAHAVHAFAEVKGFWERLTGTLIVHSPNAALDTLVNRWLPYQVLSCRMWGRSALYQSGGAYGFRDQLQDALTLVYAFPEETRRHILRAAGRQFVEGDVQHWWHPPRGAGVRTRFSDDYLWLPFVVLHYINVTCDNALLDESVPFLQAPRLRPEQEEDYRVPDMAAERDNVYGHCIRAIEHGLRFGVHGLPLMGAGDWNDGMNRVGAQGRGESVWNGWFLCTILNPFAELCEKRGDRDRAARFRNNALELQANLEAHAWDGQWYRRAFFDDGTPLGSTANDECRIDSLTQSWAVISGAARSDRVQQAMHAVDEHLVRRAERLVLLFEPPFDHGQLQPGYIKGYLPGIRENGGQYTHAAIWVAQAWALLGDGNRAVEILDFLNPILHSDTSDKAARYGLEPYVVAADVYSQPPHVGRGGWSWYTGSAAWYYRVVIENIFGFTLRGDRFLLKPRLPDDWPSAELTYRYRSAVYRITLQRSAQIAPAKFDGQSWTDDFFPLVDDGKTHTVVFPVTSHSPR